jgi:hypothetical protein
MTGGTDSKAIRSFHALHSFIRQDGDLHTESQRDTLVSPSSFVGHSLKKDGYQPEVIPIVQSPSAVISRE